MCRLTFFPKFEPVTQSFVWLKLPKNDGFFDRGILDAPCFQQYNKFNIFCKVRRGEGAEKTAESQHGFPTVFAGVLSKERESPIVQKEQAKELKKS